MGFKSISYSFDASVVDLVFTEIYCAKLIFVENTISKANENVGCEWILSEVKLFNALKCFQVRE
jgi:hypothetical protein